MPPSQQHSRIDTRDLKAQIERKIGHERARRYMGCLSRYLFQLERPTQTEFTKQVCNIIGVENIALHNQLVRGIVANAQRKIPPPPPVVPSPQPTSKPLKGVRRRVQVPGPLQNNSNCSFNSNSVVSSGNEDGSPPSSAAGWAANGDAFSPSTRKWRSRKGRDRRSPLGPHGKSDVITPLGNEMPARALENGDTTNSCDLYRPLHQASGVAEQPDSNINNSISLPPLKRQCIKGSVPQEQISVDSKTANEVVTVEDGEEVEQVDENGRSIVWVESRLRAPLGVPFCSASVGAAKRSVRNNQISYLTPAPSNQQEGFASDELLPDVESLQKQMEQRAVSEGLQGVSANAAKLLSHGVDIFLKNLIKSAIELKRARSCQEQDKVVFSRQSSFKTGQGVNGVWPGHSMQVQNTGTAMESAQKARSRPPLSLVDFKVAMELNPQQLGEDWPLQMEKISFRVAEEE